MSIAESREEGEVTEFMKSLDSNGVYLSGPIRCVEDNGVAWRNQIEEDYPEIDFNNPLDNYSPEEHDILSDPANFDEDSDRKQVFPSEYVTEDKIMINKSDAVFLGLPDVVARGSTMESMYAIMIGKPVFIWTIDGQTESGWLFDHAEFMHDDRDEVMQEVREWMKEESGQ